MLTVLPFVKWRLCLETNHKHCTVEMKFMKDNVLLVTTGDLIKDPKLLCFSIIRKKASDRHTLALRWCQHF